MTGSPETRAVLTCWALAACFTVFSGRLVHLQVSMADEFSAKAAEKHVTRQTIHAKRGMIRDVHGELLAQNEPIKTVIANGSLIENHAAVAGVLAGPLKMRESQLIERLRTQRSAKSGNKQLPSPYIVVKKNVPERLAMEIAAELSSRKLRGISFEHDSSRTYPNGSMLCHVLGFVNSENAGVEGIEASFDQYLGGHDGFRYIERDRTGRELVPYRGQERAPRDGFNVRLTIDMGLQNIVETELDIAVQQLRPKMAAVIMMRPQTGEILALANRPHFDLNQQEGVLPENRKNRAIADMVEPGSTFKIVPVSAALQLKIVQHDTMIWCENAHFSYGGKRLRDTHAYGDLTVSEILIKSSNIGAAKLGIQLGEQKLYEYVRRFGFGERTGIDLPGEISGVVHPPHRWSKISITHLPMGHEVGVTPLQVVTAMAAIANGGRLMVPQIVREITDGNGHVVQEFAAKEVRQVISEETAAAVRDALVGVVGKKGTARLAHVSGYKVAGKTGTANKIGAHGTYVSGKNVVSFAGFLPADAPEFVVLVLIDEAIAPLNYGGLVAAPIFSRIGERAARYLNLVPTPEEPPGDIILTRTERIRD